MVGVSKAYVKSIRQGARKSDSAKASAVKYCEEMIVEGQKVLLATAAEIIAERLNNKSHK